MLALGGAVALLNLLNYLFHWFRTIVFYDELVQGVTSLWLRLVCWTLYRLRAGFSLPQVVARRRPR